MIATLLTALTLAPAPIDVRVEGEGYLRLAREGRVVFATQARLSVTNGRISAGNGAEPLPAIRVPEGATAIMVDLEGRVRARISGTDTQVGRLVLAFFPKGTALTPENGFLTSPTRASLGNPGEGTNGVIRMNGGAPAPATANQAIRQNPTVRPTPAPRSVSGIEISVRAESFVERETFTLGEIAEIRADAGTQQRLAAIEMGRSPSIGISRGIDRSFVEMKLRSAGQTVRDITVSVPGGAKITRRAQVVPASQLETLAREAIKQQLGIEAPLKTTTRFPDFNAPTGELEMVVETTSKTPNGATATVAIRVNGVRLNARSISFVFDTTAAGVRAGAPVKIFARRSGATIELEGRARTTAWLGQTVTVVTTTGSTLTGTVTAADTVEVKF